MDALILSNALDTNGQNARYARSAEKWGVHENVLKALAIGKYDPAGVMGRFQIAAEKFGNLAIRSVHRSQHIYQQMPADIVWSHRNERQIRQLIEDADLVHLNNSTVAAQRFRIRNKPLLLHHHGSLFRSNPRHWLQEARNWRALQAVSTVDLMRPAPDLLHWLPTAYDIDWLTAFANEHRDQHDGIRIVQCPTDGYDPRSGKEGPYKSTNALRAAVERVKAKGIGVELVLVTGMPWIEALAIKATADIYFDQVKLGYGCNAVEAWGMGIPVIAGADAWTLAKMREIYGTLPFYEASEDTIEQAIIDLASSKAKRTTYAKRGMAHVRRFHDELPALTRLAELYGQAMLIEDGPRLPDRIEPVTFMAKVPQLRVGGKYATFVNGRYTTDNPYIATQLRAMAMRRPQYGIEEIDDAA